MGDRYGRGTGDYVNCPLNREEYAAFYSALVSAERAKLHEFEKAEIFSVFGVKESRSWEKSG